MSASAADHQAPVRQTCQRSDDLTRVGGSIIPNLHVALFRATKERIPRRQKPLAIKFIPPFAHFTIRHSSTRTSHERGAGLLGKLPAAHVRPPACQRIRTIRSCCWKRVREAEIPTPICRSDTIKDNKGLVDVGIPGGIPTTPEQRT